MSESPSIPRAPDNAASGLSWTAENAIYYRDKGREEAPWGQELRVVPVYRGRNRKSERERLCVREWK